MVGRNGSSARRTLRQTPVAQLRRCVGVRPLGEPDHDNQHKSPNPKPENGSTKCSTVSFEAIWTLSRRPGRFPLNLHVAEHRRGLQAVLDNQCWLRKDSFGVNTLQTRLIQDMRRGNAMVWETIMVNPERNGDDALELIQRYLDLGCCYVGIGFNAWNALYVYEHHLPVYRKLQEKIGYRLRPSIVWRRQFIHDVPEVVMGIVNDGCASPPGTVSLQARFSGGARVTCPIAVGQPAPGAVTQVSIAIRCRCPG